MVNNTPALVLSSRVFVTHVNSQLFLKSDAHYPEEIPKFILIHPSIFLLFKQDDTDYPHHPLSYSDSDSDDYLSLYLKTLRVRV